MPPTQRRPSATHLPDPPEELTIITTRAASLDYPRPTGLYTNNPQSSPSPNNITVPGSAQPAYNFSRPSPLGRTPQDTSLLHSGLPSARSGSASSSNANFPSIIVGTGYISPQLHPHAAANNNATLSSSQLAAQTAFMQQPAAAHIPVHSRQRSQTVPAPGEELAVRARTGPLSPPMLSLTEASAPRDTSSGLLGAAAAATAAFPRVNTNVPAAGTGHVPSSPHVMAPSPLGSNPTMVPEKKEGKRKLFSRPGKISVKDTKERALPSPGKIGSAFSSALQRGNYSSTNLSTGETVGPGSSSGSLPLYSLGNASVATIRGEETGGKEKEKDKKHHFLSRQKQKLKEDFHVAASPKTSASSLYNFHVGAPPGGTSGFKGHSVKKDKKAGEMKLGEVDPGFDLPPAVLSTIHAEMQDAKLAALNQLGPEDAWPYLRSKIIVVFEAEEVRVPVEDLNRIVLFHLQNCITRRTPMVLLEDLRELFTSGFMALDRAMRKTPEDRTIPELVEFWMFTFTVVLPYLQAVFLPLDVEFSGNGTLVSREQALEFWGAVNAISEGRDTPQPVTIRSLVLTAYRDIVVLPRYDILKTIFSRLSLEFLPPSLALASPPPEMSGGEDGYMSLNRPGTAASVPLGTTDTQFSSFGFSPSSSTLLNEYAASSVHETISSAGTRSRAISNVSYGSNLSDGAFRPFTPSSLHINISNTLGAGSVLGSTGNQTSGVTIAEKPERRERSTQEDSEQVAGLVGRMLQCVSVLGSLEVGDEGGEKMAELGRLLKLNWLGRGRTGRNRRGLVGGRVRRGVRMEV